MHFIRHATWPSYRATKTLLQNRASALVQNWPLLVVLELRLPPREHAAKKKVGRQPNPRGVSEDFLFQKAVSRAMEGCIGFGSPLKPGGPYMQSPQKEPALVCSPPPVRRGLGHGFWSKT
jgi:hypothetical protein